KPWWDMAHPVWICPDSYRPEITEDKRSGVRQYCDHVAYWNPAGEVCKCGPNLMNCARDGKQLNALIDATNGEPIRTIQHVVQAREPFSNVLTMRSTVRAGLAELHYAKNRYYRTGTFSMDPPDEGPEAKLRDRDPEFEGGVLTTPIVAIHDTARRIVVS